MPAWTLVEIDERATRESTDAARDRDVKPPRTFYTEFNTLEPAQREAFMQWLLDPLPVLMGQVAGIATVDPNVIREDVIEQLDGLRLADVGSGWRAVTVLRNHHQGLNPRINMCFATVSTEEETVYTDVYKQKGSD